jgi:NtrC-family two-component system sensor histidine kinase KinB
MALRRLNTRFLLSSALLVTTTIACGVWSGWTLAHLSRVVDSTLSTSQVTIDLAAALASSIEREDDALLLALTGDVARAGTELASQRKALDDVLSRLLAIGGNAEEEATARQFEKDAQDYRARCDEFLRAERPDAERYHKSVNPALRRAVADCARLRELEFTTMQLAGIRARDEARRATWIVVLVSLAALLLSTGVAVHLTRTVVRPIRALTSSVEEVRLGHFGSRVAVESLDELGNLAEGFNRMAGALDEFRKMNIEEVVRAKETLEATLATLPDAVFVIDGTGKVVAMNTRAEEVVEAAGTKGLVHASELPLSEEGKRAVEAALRGERVRSSRLDLERALALTIGGAPRRLLPLALPTGRHGAVVVLSDVTEFAELDKLRAELIAVTSHELRSPLTTLRMNLLLMDEGAEQLGPRQREILATAVQGCEELAKTVEELLDLTRVEAGQLRLDLGRHDLTAVVERSVEAARPRFEDAGVAIRLSKASGLAPVQIDALRMQLVLANVLSNALKYSSRGGTVAVAVSFASGQFAGVGAEAAGKTAVTKPASAPLLHVSVTDEGPGVPADFRERVFEKFFRVEHHLPSTEPRPKGTGVGLYLCREIVQAHGGRIRCEAGEAGRGARFVIEIPGLPDAT